MERFKTGALALAAFFIGSVAPAAEPAKTGPSFDCAKATGEVQRLICKDAGLAALDRRLIEMYTGLIQRWPQSLASKQAKIQGEWVKGRDACAKAGDPRACTELSYRTRIVDLQLQTGQVKTKPSVAFDCTGGPDKIFFAAFYPETDPASAVFSYAKKLVIAFTAPAASGSKYTAANVEFWEHQGEASVNWFGTTLKCGRHVAPPPAAPAAPAPPAKKPA